MKMNLTFSKVKVLIHFYIVWSAASSISCAFLSFFLISVSSSATTPVCWNNTDESFASYRPYIAASLCVGVGLSGLGRHGISNCRPKVSERETEKKRSWVLLLLRFSLPSAAKMFSLLKKRKNKNNRLETVKCAAADDIPRVRLPAGQ